MKSLEEQFNQIALQYDKQRTQFIPCFSDFYAIALENLNFDIPNPIILDLGAGTGLFSHFVLQKYPDASITLVDISDKMLSVAETRFKDRSNLNFCRHDIVSYQPSKPVDAVISSLAIHHLEDDDKISLYNQIYKILNEGGIFVNADQVEGATPYMKELNHQHWLDRVEKSTLTRQEKDAGYERVKLDKRVPIKTQLTWLRNAGFEEVDCLYKYYDFTVMYCKK